MALVTVLMPVFNMAATIAMSIDSVLSQTHRELELLVIDDGSKDATVEEASRYLPGGEKADPRVRLIRENHGGKLAALDAGLRQAKGEYTGILDADDTWPPESAALRARALADRPDAVGVYADANYMDYAGKVYRTRKSRPYESKYELVTSLIVPIIGTTLMVRTEVFKKLLPLDRSFVRSDDAYINIELASKGPLIYLPQVILNYRNYPRPDNLRLRLRSIYHDIRLINRYCSGAWLIRGYLFKVAGGLLKFAYEAVNPKK